MEDYKCTFLTEDNTLVTKHRGIYNAESPEAATKMLHAEFGAITTTVQVTWGLMGNSVVDLSETIIAEQKEKEAQRDEAFRQLLPTLKDELSKLPDNADYLDLPPDLRKSLQDFEDTITATPLRNWNEDEKSIFRFWKRIERYGRDDGALGNSSTQRSKESQLLAQILNEQKIQTRQLTALRWMIAMFILWLVVHLYLLPMMQQ
jgi:hypothetical protein